jgi:hypothetical protein
MTDNRVSEPWWPVVSAFLANGDGAVEIEHPCVSRISCGAGGYYLDWCDGDAGATEAKDVFSRLQWVDDVFELRCVLLTLAYLEGNQ